VFFDIVLKETAKGRDDKGASSVKGRPDQGGEDESIKRLKERLDSLELKWDLLLQEIRGGKSSLPKVEKGEAERPARELEPDDQRERLARKLRDIIQAMEQKPGVTPQDVNGKGIPPEVLSHIYQAQKFFYGNQYKAALKELDRSLELGETALALALKGTVHIAIKEKSEALKAWRRALELDPTMVDVQNAIKFYEGETPK